MPERRPHDRSDEGHVATTLLGRDPLETAELAGPSPVVRIRGNPLRIRPFSQREQNDTPAPPHGRVGQRKRQRPAAANNRQRSAAIWRLWYRAAHGAASESPLPPPDSGIIGERLPPARMKDTIFPITGSSANFTLVRCTRSAKVESPKNSMR